MVTRRLSVVLLALFVLALPGAGGEGTCPDDMVPTGVEGVCIDRYEWPNEKGVKPLLGVSAVAEQKDLDAGLVMDAERLCKSVGKRVCKLAEWRSACRGPDGAQYPFGDEIPKIEKPGEGPCNFTQHYRDADGMKIYRRDKKHMEWLDQSDPAGAREECRSESGAYDMIGNAEEWVTCPRSVSRRGENCRGSGKDQVCYCMVSRYWSSPVTCDSIVTGHAPNWHWYESTGRCCLGLEEE